MSTADARPTSVKVTAHRTADDAQKQPYTLYVLLIEWEPGTVWTVEHRFSEFETLRAKLSENVQHLAPLPGKTWLRSFSADFIEKRRQQLHTWIQTLLTNEYVVRSKEFRGFLEVDANVSQTIDQQATEIKSFTDPQFGVNDFVYDEQHGIILTACEDVHMFSRLDSKLSNWKLPWEKQAGCIVPIGSFTCWRLDPQGEFKPSCTLYFDCQVSTVAWDPARRYAIIGLESGNIIFYFVDTTFSEFTVVQELDHHKDRVTGLIYNSTRDILISSSRDKRCVVYDMKQDKVVSEGICSKAWISSMAYDEKFHRVFLGTYSQTILIYSLETNPPTLLHTLTGHSGSVRCLSYRPRERYLFSGGFDANAGIWSIESGDQVRRSRSVGWLTGGPQKKIKSIVFCPSMRQVITGMDGGNIAVWDTTNGKLKHVIKTDHEAVTGLRWLDDVHVLVTSSHDGKVKFWKFPDTNVENRETRASSTIDLANTAPHEEKSSAMMDADDDPEVRAYRQQQERAEQAQLKLAESASRPKGSSHQITAPAFESAPSPKPSTSTSTPTSKPTSKPTSTTTTPRTTSTSTITSTPTTSTSTSTSTSTLVSSLREPEPVLSQSQRHDPVEIVQEDEADIF